MVVVFVAALLGVVALLTAVGSAVASFNAGSTVELSRVASAAAL